MNACGFQPKPIKKRPNHNVGPLEHTIVTRGEINTYTPRTFFTCSITAAPSIMPYARMSIASTGLSGSSA